MPTKIDTKKCIGCGECVEVCPVCPVVYKMTTIRENVKKAVVQNPKACIDCGACSNVCPADAIKKED